MPVPLAIDVAAALSRAWSKPVTVSASERIAPWNVARFHVAGGAHASVVVKWRRSGDPDDPSARAHPSQLVTESIALQHLESLGIPAPRVIEMDAQMLVLEDLGNRMPLDKLITAQGYDQTARSYLRSTAKALGERHAATAQDSRRFYSRFVGLQQVDPERERARFLGRGWERTARWFSELGCVPPQRVIDEAEQIRHTLIEAGPFLAMSNGDSATNNVLVHHDSVMFIDYEFAGFRHCLADLTDFYLPGPRFVTVGDPVASGFEEAYREAVSSAIPQVADDHRFGHDLAAAGFAHAFGRTANLPVVDPRPHGDRSRLERMNVLERAADLAESRTAFGYVTDWCRSLAAVLRRRWPDADVPTNDLPPFLPRG